jgi:hypothetical protein
LVVVLSQVIEVAGTLVQEFTGVQLRAAIEQVVVHVPVCAKLVIPTELASAMTTRRPAKTKTLLMDSSFRKTKIIGHNCYFLFLLLALLFGACGGKEDPQSMDPGPRQVEIQHQEGDAAAATAGAALRVEGDVSFDGASPFFCVPHEGSGLQVDFRTGNAGLPTVAVRIEDYRGSGPYQARLFVTGRSETGALVTSEGEANVDLRQQGGAEGALVSGSFHGSYGGEAGKGSIEGRFGSCSYSTYAGGSPPLGPLAAGPAADPSQAGGEGQPAGASEEETPP